MKIEQLQHLMAIVESGSLRSAARRLGLPQPALTRSIRALEKKLGGSLFLRETTGMTLTETGRRFHVRASNIVNEARRAQDEIDQYRGDDRGTVVAALSIMPHVGMLPFALKKFRERYPDIKLQIIEGLFPDVEAPLRQGAVDFYLGAAPRSQIAPGLKMQKLFENRRAVVCRKGHPLSASRSLRSLQNASWAITGVDYNVEDDIARLFESHNLRLPKVVLQASSAMSIMVSLAHSDLLAMLPVQWEEFPMTRDALQVIQIREPLLAPAIVLVQRPDFPLTPAAEHFSDLLRRYGPT
jgi:LysR family transcriptional regulator of abg operon